MTNTNLLKSKMIAAGDENYVEVLASLLKISRTTASKKLNGKTPFSQSEIAILVAEYHFSAEEIKDIFIDGVE